MQKHEEWLNLAQEDLKVSEVLINLPELILGPIYFHAQQCAEKALKAYLISRHQPAKRTHDLVALVEKCIKLDPEFESIAIDAASLNPYLSGTRYPDTAFMMLDATTARISVEQAKKILEFVKCRI